MVYLALIGLSIPNVNPSKMSLRTLIVVTCICTAVVLWGFQAGITSVLTVDVADLPIKSIKVFLITLQNQYPRKAETFVKNSLKSLCLTLTLKIIGLTT